MSNTPDTTATPSKQLTKAQAYTVHALTVLLTIIGGVLAVADKITALPLPPELTKYWGLILALAIGAKPTVLLLGDLFDDGKINQSFGKAVAIIVAGALLTSYLAGCLSTTTGDPVKNAHNTAINRTLTDAGAILGKVAVQALFSAALTEANGGKADFQQAGAQALQANVDVAASATEIRGIISDFTAGNAPSTAKAAAKAVGDTVTPEKVQAVANVIFAATGAPPAK